MKVCPKCGREFDRLLAVSRVDNRTMICDTCGNMEALEAMENKDGKSITEILKEVCEDICNNYCKHRDTADEEYLCNILRDGGSCPLDRLN